MKQKTKQEKKYAFDKNDYLVEIQDNNIYGALKEGIGNRWKTVAKKYAIALDKNFDKAIQILEKLGYKVYTSEGFVPNEIMRSEVWTKSKRCIFKGKNANELIKFAEKQWKLKK